MLDPLLRALAGCPVIEHEEGGAMVFCPHPVITADSDPILAHEICHVLGGRDDFEIFTTAVEARKSRLFRHILNMLFDWYHESIYGQYSGYLNSKLDELHKIYDKIYKTNIKAIDDLYEGYASRSNILERMPMPHGDVIDLVVLADQIMAAAIKQAHMSMAALLNLLGIGDQEELFNEKGKSKLGGPKSDINTLPKQSNYYISAVARYYDIIEALTDLWKRNKYGWINDYYGEINWKNLPAMFIGDLVKLPVWRLFQKIFMSRKIYLVIDRSGSTYGIKELIMDTAVILSESLRMLDVPISILDVGVTNSVINDIDDPLDLTWFTPMDRGGTPLGEVCSLITKADKDSYLLIVTDGCPDSWDTLQSSLNAFPGCHLTFVIGDDYGSYVERIGNAIHVEPHTIIREVMQNENLR